jgi:hypothetical protein
VAIDFAHISDCILELLWLSTFPMLQTVFWNCCGYQLWPCFRLYLGTVVAIYFAHVSNCILELLWLSTLAMVQTVFWNCCGYPLWPCFRLYFGTVEAIDFALAKVDSHNSFKIQSVIWTKSIATTVPKYSLKHGQSR